MTEEENKQIAISRNIEKHWDKMVADSKRISGYNFNQYGEDLLMFCLSEFLNKKTLDYKYQVCVIDDKLPNYMGRAMSMNIKSNTSPFWGLYRKTMYNNRELYPETVDYEKEYGYESEEPNYDFDLPEHKRDAMSCILYYLHNLGFYHKALVEDYYINQLTYVQMNKKYGITLASLKKGVAEGLERIKQKCKHTRI